MLQSAWFDLGFLAILFCLAALSNALFFITTMYFLVRSYYGHTYRAMPFAMQLKEYRDELRQWNITYGTADGDREWEEFLEDSYAHHADFNANVNEIRSKYLFRARGAIVGCAVSTVLAFVPFAIHRALSPTPPQRIEVVNQGKLITEKNQTMPPQTKPPEPPPKPQAPPFRVLKEGAIPKKK